MDDMQRYRDIKAQATDDDPTAKLRAYLTVAFDQALAESIRLERQGKPGKVRALGFIETADLLEQTTSAGRCGHFAPGLELLPASVQLICSLSAGHAGWHRSDSDSGCEWGVPTTDETTTAPR